MNTSSAKGFVIATRAASGYVYLSRKATAAALAGTTDRADAMAWPGLAGVLNWVNALTPDARETLRDRAPFAIDPNTRAALPLLIPDWDWDAAWSPSLSPIDVELCHGKSERRSTRKTVAEPSEGLLLKASA